MEETLRSRRALLRAASLVLAAAVVAAPSLAVAVDKAVLEGVVNINTASADELQMLPGVGEVRAEAILQKRKDAGGFKSVDELLEVRGVGDALLERVRPYVTLKGKTTAERQ